MADYEDPSRAKIRERMPLWSRMAEKRVQAAAEGSWSPWPFIFERLANIPVWQAEQGLGGALGGDYGDQVNKARNDALLEAIGQAESSGAVPPQWINKYGTR